MGIDHLVIVVRDLDRAAKDYERLGFTVIEGGRHPVGSYNVLIPFADGSYLEIISFYREAVEHRWWAPLQKGERLVDFCMRTDDLMGDTAKLRAAGVAINDPVPWSRTRPDGYELRWLLALATGPHRGVAPFLIEDLTPREERVPQTFEHANGATGIATVTIGVEELSPVIKWYESALGTKGNAVKDTVLNAAAVRFRAGDQVLHYVMPDGESGPLARWLREYGPSP
ncbi:MAG TPA: VOC family protein, partial [Candidatus Eisenbacteria bacterium]|nr:VOC family protein [Candidatus Eisenbacteria bacterium]